MKVSISCITYNHAPYIRQCLEGFLIQKCDFDFEVLIHDDASTDGTVEIIKEYQQKFPEIIKPIFQIENQWSKGIRGMNQKFNYPRAVGQYFALCEGDDYWTDPRKLQKQIDFLQANKDYALCFHSSKIKFEATKEFFDEVAAEDRNYTADELVLTKVAHTASFVFRNFDEVPDSLSHKAIFGGDVMLALLLADQGKVYGMKDYMSVYRKHEGGVTNIPPTAMIAHQKRMMGQFLFMKKHIKSADPTAFQRKVFDHAITVAMLYKKQKNYGKTVLYLMKAVKYYPGILTKVILKPFKKLK